MTNIIHVGSVQEDVKRSLNNVLINFFNSSSVTTKFVSGRNVKFPKASIKYDIKELEKEDKYKDPIIGIIGTRMSDYKKFKCEINGVPSPVFRTISYKTVYVKVIKSFPLINHNQETVNSSRYMDETWGLIDLIFKTQVTLFSNNGIRIISFPSTPVDASNEQESISYGSLVFQFDFSCYID
jgi:hypothetical protein